MMDFIDETPIRLATQDSYYIDKFNHLKNDLIEANSKALSSKEIIRRKYRLSVRQAIAFMEEYIDNILNNSHKSLTELNIIHQDLQSRIQKFFGKTFSIPSEEHIDSFYGFKVDQTEESTKSSQQTGPKSDEPKVENSCQPESLNKNQCNKDSPFNQLQITKNHRIQINKDSSTIKLGISSLHSHIFKYVKHFSIPFSTVLKKSFIFDNRYSPTKLISRYSRSVHFTASAFMSKKFKGRYRTSNVFLDFKPFAFKSAFQISIDNTPLGIFEFYLAELFHSRTFT